MVGSVLVAPKHPPPPRGAAVSPHRQRRVPGHPTRRRAPGIQRRSAKRGHRVDRRPNQHTPARRSADGFPTQRSIAARATVALCGRAAPALYHSRGPIAPSDLRPGHRGYSGRSTRHHADGTVCTAGIAQTTSQGIRTGCRAGSSHRKAGILCKAYAASIVNQGVPVG